MGTLLDRNWINCCSCPEPPDYDAEVDDPLPKYLSKCGCPSVVLVCESEQRTATICGRSEYVGDGYVASSPPKKYQTETYTFDFSWKIYGCECNDAPVRTITYDEAFNFTFVKTRDCSGTISPPSQLSTVYNYSYDEVGVGEDCVAVLSDTTSYNNTVIFEESAAAVITSPTTAALNQDSDGFTLGCGGLAEVRRSQRNWVLTDEDTEDDALTRATPTDGTSCSSLYQLRTNSFTFTQRTSTYTATASNLVVGVQYEGCVRLRRREAYRGTLPEDADTEWYDVEPDTIAAFTATSQSEELAADVEIPIEQGWEYEAVGAYVWPVSAGCDCPTS